MIIIFLDIDGVLFRVSDSQIEKHLRKRYAELKIEPSKQDFSAKEWAEACAELLDKQALEYFNQLIAIIESRGESVGIVVSSDWRRRLSVVELQKLFQQHAFSKKIIDKIADNIDVIDDEIGIHLPLERGEQIDVWLQQNRERFNVSNFLVIDDVDAKISELFGNHFIHCRDSLFSQRDLDLATSLLVKQSYLADDKEKYPVNKLNLTFSSLLKKSTSGISVSTESLMEQPVRLSLSKRKCFLTYFFVNKTSLSVTTAEKDKTCTDLIIEYAVGSHVL